MKYAFPLTSVMVFAIFSFLFMMLVKRSRRRTDQKMSQFWQQETAANQVRKQDISTLDYVYIPFETLPFGVGQTSEITRLEGIIRELDTKQIVNLSQYTNTELKLKYGVANLDILSACDERFTTLIRTLYQWSCLLLNSGHLDAAIQVAEYSIDIGSDISGCYYMLADYYNSIQDATALNRLRESADKLTGLNANAIKDYLNKSPE